MWEPRSCKRIETKGFVDFQIAKNSVAVADEDIVSKRKGTFYFKGFYILIFIYEYKGGCKAYNLYPII